MKHLRGLPGVPSPSSLGSRPPAFLRAVPWVRALAGRRRPVDVAPPTTQTAGELREEVLAEMNALIDERFGVTHCPNCGEKVAVLVDGVCRDCGPGVA